MSDQELEDQKVAEGFMIAGLISLMRLNKIESFSVRMEDIKDLLAFDDFTITHDNGEFIFQVVGLSSMRVSAEIVEVEQELGNLDYSELN